MALADWTYVDDGWSTTLSSTQKHSGAKSLRQEKAAGFPQGIQLYISSSRHTFSDNIYISGWVYFPTPYWGGEYAYPVLNGGEVSGTRTTAPNAGAWHQYEWYFYLADGVTFLKRYLDSVLQSDTMFTNTSMSGIGYNVNVGIGIYNANNGYTYIDDVVIKEG